MILELFGFLEYIHTSSEKLALIRNYALLSTCQAGLGIKLESRESPSQVIICKRFDFKKKFG